MGNYPKEFAHDAAYQSHSIRLTELWSLPRPTQGLSTYLPTYLYCSTTAISLTKIVDLLNLTATICA